MTKPDTFEKIVGVAEPSKQVIAAPNDNLPTNRANEQQFDTDFERSRVNLIHVIGETNKALTTMLMIANDKEDAKSFEAVNGLLKTLAQTSKDLLEIHSAKKSFYEPTKSAPNGGQNIVNGNVIQNAVFQGTPNEFKEYIAKAAEEKSSTAPVIDGEVIPDKE